MILFPFLELEFSIPLPLPGQVASIPLPFPGQVTSHVPLPGQVFIIPLSLLEYGASILFLFLYR